MQLGHHAHPYLAFFFFLRKEKDQQNDKDEISSFYNQLQQIGDKDDHTSTATIELGIWIDQTQ